MKLGEASTSGGYRILYDLASFFVAEKKFGISSGSVIASFIGFFLSGGGESSDFPAWAFCNLASRALI
jgi:hypothetical protein